MHLINNLSVFICFIAVTACNTHVTYWKSDRELPDPRSHDAVVRVFVDYLGDVYPLDSNRAASHPPCHRDRLVRAKLLSAPRSGIPPMCTKAIFRQELDGSTCRCKNAHTGDYETEWRREQHARWKSVADRVGEIYRGTQSNALVILIHGFNNDEASARESYGRARDRITRVSAPDGTAPRPLFVEVYWDGRHPSALPVIGNFIHRQWSSAQYSGPLVGLKMRAFINQLDGDMPVRVLTHSSGAFVAASLLGDATTALPEAQKALTQDNDEIVGEYQIYQRYAQSTSDDFRVPSRADLRVGMLAAATPPGSFSGGSDVSGGTRARGAHLMFGVNQSDEAIVKHGLGTDIMGATGMGTGGPNHVYLKEVKSSLSQREITVDAFDFEQPGEDCSDSSHAFTCYLTRPCIRWFLDDLMRVPPSDRRCRIDLPSDVSAPESAAR